jgi:DNA-binding NarL/FixJ family response regulator
MIAGAIWGPSMTAIAVGRDHLGVRLFAAAQRLSDTIGVPGSRAASAALERARSRISPTACDAAWSHGRALSTHDAIELASNDPRASSSPTVPTLTTRELKVLQLVATGRTNAEIAGELVLSVRTVENHVSHVYRKLRLRNRAQATRFAATHGLLAEV